MFLILYHHLLHFLSDVFTHVRIYCDCKIILFPRSTIRSALIRKKIIVGVAYVAHALYVASLSTASGWGARSAFSMTGCRRRHTDHEHAKQRIDTDTMDGLRLHTSKI